MRIVYLLFVTALVWGTLPFSLAAEQLTVFYPRPETASDNRTEYPLKLLELAFSKVQKPYQLIPTPQVMPQGRALLQLQSSLDVDIVWSMTSKERELKLQPIRVPIYKGLIGWRIFLANKESIGKFKPKLTIDELRQFGLVQGHDWPDTDILRANGFSVVGASNYNSIFAMLSRSRVDLFPRSIVEVWAEAETYRDSGIVVEPTKIVVYPTAFYYFVTPGNVELSEALEKGLRAALDDGSFDLLFEKHHSGIIKRANLSQRQMYLLENPMLPAKTPLKESKLWFSANPS